MFFFHLPLSYSLLTSAPSPSALITARLLTNYSTNTIIHSSRALMIRHKNTLTCFFSLFLKSLIQPISPSPIGCCPWRAPHDDPSPLPQQVQFSYNRAVPKTLGFLLADVPVFPASISLVTGVLTLSSSVTQHPSKTDTYLLSILNMERQSFTSLPKLLILVPIILI